MKNTVEERTPIMLKRSLKNLEKQDKALNEAIDMAKMGLLNDFDRIKEKNRQEILDCEMIYEELKNSIRLLDLTLHCDRKYFRMLEKIKEKREENIALVMKLETTYFLEKNKPIFLA